MEKIKVKENAFVRDEMNISMCIFQMNYGKCNVTSILRLTRTKSNRFIRIFVEMSNSKTSVGVELNSLEFCGLSFEASDAF